VPPRPRRSSRTGATFARSRLVWSCPSPASQRAARAARAGANLDTSSPVGRVSALTMRLRVPVRWRVVLGRWVPVRRPSGADRNSDFSQPTRSLSAHAAVLKTQGFLQRKSTARALSLWIVPPRVVALREHIWSVSVAFEKTMRRGSTPLGHACLRSHCYASQNLWRSAVGPRVRSHARLRPVARLRERSPLSGTCSRAGSSGEFFRLC